MTRSEYQSWIQFYRRWPFDDFHRFHRPAALIASSMAENDMQQLLDYLQPPVRVETYSDVDRQLLNLYGYGAS